MPFRSINTVEIFHQTFILSREQEQKVLVFINCKTAKTAVIQLTQILYDEEPLLVVDQLRQLVRNSFSPADGVPANQDGVVPWRSPHDRDHLVR